MVVRTAADRYERFVNLSSIPAIEPLTVDRALGAQLWDEDGNSYIDCFSGIAVVNTGHGHPHVVEATRAQLERLIHCGTYLYRVPVVGELAERLAQVSPGRLEKTFFCTSGAEAVEGALRLAKAYTKRAEFVALDLGFHGRTNATLAVTGNRKRKHRGGPYVSGVAFAPAPYEYRCRFCHGKCNLACADAVEDVIQYRTSGDVAAFIAEPVLGEGGIIVPHPDYFTKVKEILDRHGILFIVDEVQTGFGRTGRLFGIEHFGVEPDIMTMAKGIAAGLPLGGFTARPDIADSFLPGEHFSTFGGNPVACAAGLASLDVIEGDHLCDRAAELGSLLLSQCRDLASRHSSVGDVRGLGLMVGLELVRDSTRAPFPELASRIRAACRKQGVLVGVGGFFGNVVRIQPPLVIDEEQLGEAVGAVDRALAEAAA
jgi:4-aminobutyrate aminotransferase